MSSHPVIDPVISAPAPHLGLGEEDSTAVANVLNRLLADEFVLYVKTRRFHWNVTGRHFHALHAFFETQYEALSDALDEVAERTRTIGGRTLGTVAGFMAAATLHESHDGAEPDAQQMVETLLRDHEHVIRSLRRDIESVMDEYHDAGTSDFLTGLLTRHEKMAWMLRSYFPDTVV